MRTLITTGLIAGALVAGIGSAAADPLPLTDPTGAAIGFDGPWSASGTTGSSSGTSNFLKCYLFDCPNQPVG